MKKLLLVSIMVFVVVSAIGTANALVIDSVPILVIDGDDDGTTVNIGLIDDVVTGFDFGFINDTGTYMTLLSDGNTWTKYTWNGGDEIDFAIRNIVTGYVYSLGEDENGNNYCTLSFSGEIPAEYSVNPIVESGNYWNTVNMKWGVPTSIPGYPGDTSVGFNVAMSITSIHDGVAPVPEPATMLLFGSALLGLLGFRKKRA